MRLLLCCLLCFALSSCEPEVELSSPSQVKAVLLPQLRDNLDQLESLTISTQNASISIENKESGWKVAHPYDVPAYEDFVAEALVALSRAGRGQRVTVEAADYSELSLSGVDEGESESVRIDLKFSNLVEPISLILGAFSFPRDQEATAAYGESATARRYVRFLKTGEVYLTPASLTFLSPDSRHWEERALPPIKRLQRIKVEPRAGAAWSAYRGSSYGPIELITSKGAQNQTPDLIKLFSKFLSSGHYEGVVPQGMELSDQTPALKITADDRFGAKYRIDIYEEEAGVRAHLPEDQLREGFLTMKTEERLPSVVARVTLSRSGEDQGALKSAQAVKGRLIYLSRSELLEIEEITKSIGDES